MFDILITLIFGIIIGTITGIMPGLHVNTVGIIIFSTSPTLLSITNPLVISTFLVSIALTHAMIEFIPSLLMGIPSEDTVLSVQPGHRMLFKGESMGAIRLVSFGGYCSIVLLIIIMPILFIVLPLIYYGLKEYIGILLIIIMILILYFSNKSNNKRLMSTLIFLISGIMGLVLLNGNLGSNIALLSMLSGLFSVSNLIYSINNNSKIPHQKDIKNIVIDSKFKKSVFAGSISGCIMGLLPGLGPAQGTLIAQIITLNKDIKVDNFLVTNSGINVCDTLFSLIAIYLISNPRSAISVYVNNLIEDITLIHILFFICVSLVCVSVTCVVSIKLGDLLIKNIKKVDYNKLNIFIVVLISMIVFFYTILSQGCIWYVILCYITSISLGILVNTLDLSKSNLMGVLIIPSILTYIGII
ncbi:tripartite tricarboxylate transporter permease [Methanosphaera stadtmanae]|uniref:tripartite tricarboxylate transporter permease n=1 Tax=Methanosphaera stadtmanae TaxID=2317 RepID=UPI0026666130|nr:tripartite tricarboxylate transporter permease [Methanosphaera stadtmanae]